MQILIFAWVSAIIILLRKLLDAELSAVSCRVDEILVFFHFSPLLLLILLLPLPVPLPLPHILLFYHFVFFPNDGRLIMACRTDYLCHISTVNVLGKLLFIITREGSDKMQT